MRDRLQHMHTLLADDGSIWVHLDDVENHRMRVLLDEVFGPENFVAEVVWGKADTSRNDARQFSVDQDYICIYSKNLDWSPNRLPRTSKQDSIYGSPDGDPRPWIAKPGHAPGASTHQGMVYAVQSPFTGELLYPPTGGCWRLGQAKMFESLNKWSPYKKVNLDDAKVRAGICGIPEESVRSDVCALVLADDLKIASKNALQALRDPWPEVFFINAGTRIQVKGHLPEGGTTPRTIWDFKTVGSNRNSKAEIKALFPGVSPFATPKPERLLERVIHIATNPGDIVLDIFAGSGTTAAVAQKMGRRWVTCELQEDNFTRFTRPRLEKVVRGEDHGGITTTKGERIPAAGSDLPEGMSAEDAQKFTSLLNKLITDDDDLKKSTQVKALKARAKTTKTPDTVNWRGGGGFTVARLSPACFDYDETLGLTLLTDAATGDTLINSVAANLNFYRTPDHPVFHGVRGRMRLVVVEGTLLTSRVDELLAELAEGELLTVATTEPDETIRAHLRQVKRGCRLIHIPDDIFHPTTAAGLLAADTVQEA